jgi:hypothetical protein
MKTKVSQKEWNDKRDAFLCAAITVGYSKEMSVSDYTNLVNFAESITSELYELEQKLVQQYEKAMFMGQEFDNLSRPIKAEDTRPFNPKVVEIFNKFLPKEIAPLAIEAHKLSCGVNVGFNRKAVCLEHALYDCMSWSDFSIQLGNWSMLHGYTEHNTITATPEQLREWFPQAYENETSELVMLVKENYLAADGSIKKGILKDGNWYAPANDLYKNEGGENE